MTDHQAKQATIQVCSICGRSYPVGIRKCPEDGGDLHRLERDSIIGTTFLGKYEVLSILGTGGMSIVYKVRHKYMEKILALKLLNAELTHDDVAQERFRREASAASSLSHQNVVLVYDFGVTDTEPKQAYLIMDCLEGVSLADLVESHGALPIARSLQIFKQGLDGLEHAHRKHIIHRDIKPSNLVVITDEGSDLVKLVDFGIAKAAPQQGERALQQLTQTGQVFGSPLYMSPEQCNGKAMDSRSDIYSFGILMYEALSGRPPLIGESYINTVVKHLQEPPPPFSQTAPDAAIPAAVESVIMKCLAKDPDNRYATVAELRQALLDAALESGIKGYRSGAVPVIPNRSALGKTFERVKLAATGSFAATKCSRAKLTIFSLTIVGVFGVIGWLCTIPFGTPGDTLSIYNRVVWPMILQTGRDEIVKGNLKAGEKWLQQAEAMARTFDDENDRLEKTLREEFKVFQQVRNSSEQERIRKELKELVTARIIKDYELEQSHLSKYEIPVSSKADRARRQEEVRATGIGVADVAIRLHSRAKHNEEQQLLWQAIRVHEAAGLGTGQNVAEFKTQLGKCLSESQRFDQARKMLSDALQIRKSLKNRTAEESKLLAKAYLALGSFDRDQSNFDGATQELRTAIKIARTDSSDGLILLESLNAYSDLIRQSQLTGRPVADEPERAATEKEIKTLESKFGGSPEENDSFP